MSRDLEHDDAPIDSPEMLVDWFAAGAKGDARPGVGTEHEKLGFNATSLAPLPYEGPGGIGALLERLADDYDYEALEDDGLVMALLRDGAAVTLEPGGQLELSGAIFHTVHETRDELIQHLTEIEEVGQELGQRWTHLGLNPWDTPEDIPWMPKSRYVIMRDYLRSRGDDAHWMMKATCTVQANYDYSDEADALRKLALASRLSPLITTLFATTPVRQGKIGAVSERMKVWEKVDSDRCGTPDGYLRPGAGFRDVVEWCLDVPMVFVVRDERYVDVSGRPFRDLLEGRIEGIEPTIGDWELHLSALFPDVRMKQYIEVRTADAGLPGHLLALPAIWKGILYDEDALKASEALVGNVDRPTLERAAASAARQGLQGSFAGIPMQELADELIRISRAGLEAQALRYGHESEAAYLDVLVDPAGKARAPADAFQALWDACEGDRGTILEAFRLGRP